MLKIRRLSVRRRAITLVLATLAIALTLMVVASTLAQQQRTQTEPAVGAWDGVPEATTTTNELEPVDESDLLIGAWDDQSEQAIQAGEPQIAVSDIGAWGEEEPTEVP